MNTKNLWTIIIKITGIYLIWHFSFLLPQILSVIIYLRQDKTQWVSSATVLVSEIAINTILLYYFLFRTDWIILKLKLENGLDEETAKLNIDQTNVLRIAIIILGGVLFVDAIPLLFNYLFAYYQHGDAYNGFKQNPSSPWVLFAFLKGIISFFMVKENKLIANFIEKQKK